MGYIVEVSDKKVEKLSEHIEQGLRHLGKAMQCVDEWMQESGMGERGNINYRDEDEYGRYGKGGMQERYPKMGMREDYRRGSMGYRDDDDEWDMQERRRRDSRGRYM